MDESSTTVGSNFWRYKRKINQMSDLISGQQPPVPEGPVPAPVPKPSPGSAYVLEFIDNFSAHGIKYWLNWEKPFWVRVLWLWAFGFCFGYSLYLIYGHFQSFLKNDIRVSTSFDTWHETVFPAVTICPHNTAVKSIASGSMPMLTLLSQILNTPYNASLCFDPNNTHPLKSELNRGFQFFLARGGPTQALSLIAEDAARNVVICEWRGQPMNCSELFINILPDNGICFTFNADFRFVSTLMWPGPFPLRTVESAGIGNSLRILLRARPEEYCIPLYDSVGYTVHVHDPTQFPIFIGTKGQPVSPGFSTKLKISTTHTRRHTESLGKCKYKNDHPEIFGEDYKREDCYLQYISLTIIEKCVCIPQFAPPSVNPAGEKMIDYVDEENANQRRGIEEMYMCAVSEEKRICLNDQMEKFSHQNLDLVFQSCLPDCNETNYNLGSSFAYYPTPMEYIRVSQVLNLSAEQMTEERFRQEFVDVTLFLEGTSENVVIEQPRMNIEEFLANVGGAMGLFLGMSFLSLAEFVHLGVVVMRQMFFRH